MPDLLKRLDLDIRVAAAIATWCGLDPGPAPVEPIGFVRAMVLRRFELFLQALLEGGDHRLNLSGGDDAFLDESLRIDVQRRRMAADGLVHQRLGERGLV